MRILRLLKIPVVLVIVVYPFAVGSLALALSDPDSTPTVRNIKVGVNLIEANDALIYGDYNIPYASIPADAADETYIFRLLDTDGTTELGAVTPFVLFDSGYNEGVFGFYFDGSANLTLNEAYIIRIAQNPAFFEEPTSDDYAIPLSAYTSSTTQADNQVELAINIIAAAQRLESYYADYEIVEGSAGGTVLTSPTGETYFRGAIYGIQAMAPSLFLVQVMEFDTDAREWTTDQFDEYVDRFDNTWVGDDVDATATQFGITPQMLMSILFAMPLCITGIIVSSMKYKKAEPGYIFSAIVLICASVMGWLPAAIFAAIYQAMAIYIAYVWFYARG